MFKFFRDMVDAVREGIAEGRTEVAEEAAEAAAAQASAREAVQAEFSGRLAEASAFEQFAVALAAPYRQAFSMELIDAEEAGRDAVYLRTVAVAPKDVESWKKLMARDFDVNDGDDVTNLVEAMNELELLADDADPAAAALLAARIAHLASGAAAVSYFERDDALRLIAPVARVVVTRYDGWTAYAAAFLDGERHAPGSNVLGRKFLASGVDKLLIHPRSPWLTVPWPDADTVGQAVAALG